MKKLLIKVFNLVYYIILMHLIIGVLNILPNIKLSNRIRGFVLKPFFKKSGKNLQIAKGLTVNMPRNITLGDNVYIAHDVWMNGTGGLKIKDGVIISPKVVIATTKHEYVDGRISHSISSNAPITIGEGSWICSNCTITKGVMIGIGCIVGANSSVTKDIPDYTFVGGVPAVKIKDLHEKKEGFSSER